MKPISCKEAVEFMLRKEEGKLSFQKRVSLWRHLAICSLCRIFSVQNNLLNQAMKQRKEKPFKLSEAEKEKIIHNILHEKES
jgi:hypothetical protein